MERTEASQSMTPQPKQNDLPTEPTGETKPGQGRAEQPEPSLSMKSTILILASAFLSMFLVAVDRTITSTVY